MTKPGFFQEAILQIERLSLKARGLGHIHLPNQTEPAKIEVISGLPEKAQREHFRCAKTGVVSCAGAYRSSLPACTALRRLQLAADGLCGPAGVEAGIY